MTSRLIKIGKPYFAPDCPNELRADCDVDGKTRTIWFKVTPEYAKYLCFERGDAFVFGVLHWAMNNGYDVESAAPVSSELYYNLNETFIPVLVSNSSVLHRTEIKCAITAEELPCANASGSGMSCGVDSFFMLSRHYKGEYPGHDLTHLSILKVGAFSNQSQFEWQCAQAGKVASELGLPLVIGESNLADAFPEPHILTSTYRIMFGVLMMRKLWGRYFLSSDGAGLSFIDFRDNEKRACAYYDVLTCNCLSTEHLHVYPDGCSVKRFEKTEKVATFPTAYNHLHVCVSDMGGNCGKCIKCKRTLLTLDAIGRLDDFSQVFDVGHYRANKYKYLAYLYSQILLKKNNDNMVDGNDMLSVWSLLKKDVTLKAKFLGICIAARTLLSKNAFLKKLYKGLKK